MLRAPASIEAFRTRCKDGGFDLSAVLSSGWCADDPTTRLPEFARGASLAVVLGNTRALWPVLTTALRDDATLAAHPDIVEAYAERTIAAAAAATGVPFHARWAHGTEGGFLPIQRIAAIARLAWLSPAHLCVHPIFGPWIGLRAVIVFDLAPPSSPPPALADPCGACRQGCAPAFAATTDDWRSWLAVRDACPLGRAHRYGEDQLLYHYTKDRRFLGVAPTSRAHRAKASP